MRKIVIVTAIAAVVAASCGADSTTGDSEASVSADPAIEASAPTGAADAGTSGDTTRTDPADRDTTRTDPAPADSTDTTRTDPAPADSTDTTTETANRDGTDTTAETADRDTTRTDPAPADGTDTTTETADRDGGTAAERLTSTRPAGDGPGSGDGTAVSAGNGGDGVTVRDAGSSETVRVTWLASFEDCDTLLDYLRTEYSARVGPWGFDEGGWFGRMPVFDEDMEFGAVAAGSDDSATGAAAASAPVAGADFSGTNVQEAGVHEADIIKTDGRRIFTLSEGRLVVVDADDRRAGGSVAVAEGWGRELFIEGDNLLLITRSHGDYRRGSDTVLQRIEVDGLDPWIVQTLRVQGDYVSARSVDGTARVVMRYDPQWNFPFVFPRNERGEDVAERANRAAILNSTLDDWLPHYTLGSADPSTGSLMVPCADVHAPSVFSGFGVTTVFSVPVGGDLDPTRSTAVTAPGDTVYASVGSLYVTTARWVASDASGGSDDLDDSGRRRAWEQLRTSVHRFDISGAEAVYEASGEVRGVIHNQFSLSEHGGHLRIVTTVGDPWNSQSESQVRVLSTDGAVLTEVGSVGDIGRGENVQSVRFVGDVGYVVTFRQIDPFYTIDLSDPTNPRILGELKIPGFSSYLHPISETLVLGVGSDADEGGRVTGSKVSLFDVSDLAAPREVAVWTAPDGWNEVGWDHRAFLWWAPENLAVVPVTVWSEWSGAVVLRVADGAITEVGRVDHMIEGEEPGRTDCRELTPADLSSNDVEDFTTDIEYSITDDYTAVLACEPGEAGMTGFECYSEPFLVDEAERLGLLRGGEAVSVCWPIDSPSVIVRSLVIGDRLWTLGFEGWGLFDGGAPARLHAHHLQTLERLAALEL